MKTETKKRTPITIAIQNQAHLSLHITQHPPNAKYKTIIPRTVTQTAKNIFSIIICVFSVMVFHLFEF